MDEVFERILVDYDGVRSVFSMGKMAVLWELALETGRFRNAYDLGYQTFADVDTQTGEVTQREGMIPELYEDIFWCPSTSGFKSWRAMSYHPELEAFFVPIILNCETAQFGPVERVEGGGGTGPVRRTNHVHPDSPEHLGEFLAMSMRTGSQSSATGTDTCTFMMLQMATSCGRQDYLPRFRDFRLPMKWMAANLSRFPLGRVAPVGAPCYQLTSLLKNNVLSGVTRSMCSHYLRNRRADPNSGRNRGASSCSSQ